MKTNQEVEERISELSKNIVLSLVQTISNIPILIIGVRIQFWLVQLIVAYLSACTVSTWILCTLEFLDVKKMLKELNE